MLDRWHATELTVKWRSTNRLLPPVRTYCVLGYLLLAPHWSPYTHLPTHPPNAPFWHAVSPHISEQNCTSWQWCFLIFSTRVNWVKHNGPRIYKYRRRKCKLRLWYDALTLLHTGYIQHIAIELTNALGYFQTDRNQDKQRKWEKCRTTTVCTNNKNSAIMFDPRLSPRHGLEGRGELKLLRW